MENWNVFSMLGRFSSAGLFGDKLELSKKAHLASSSSFDATRFLAERERIKKRSKLLPWKHFWGSLPPLDIVLLTLSRSPFSRFSV
jgi:hypothetical protein